MLPRSQRLTCAQFNRAFSRSQNVRHPLISLKAHRRDAGDERDVAASTRAAFVVPKKQSNAAGRNRTRRRLRERYRLLSRRDALAGDALAGDALAGDALAEFDLAEFDLIFLTTPATHGASISELDAAIADVLRRMERVVAPRATRGDS